jgi:hypothetical protein
MRTSLDGDAVKRYSELLDDTADRAYDDVEAVVKKGALNIKRHSARLISGLAHAPAYPRAINYDIYRDRRGPYADIGPDKKRRQGALGNILEYGTVNNPPHPHMRPAGEAELPRFVKAVEDVTVRPLEAR